MLDHLSAALRFFGVEQVRVPFHSSHDDPCYGQWLGNPSYRPTLPTEPAFGLAEQIHRHLAAFLPNDDSIGTLTFDVGTGNIAVELDFGDEAED